MGGDSSKSIDVRGGRYEIGRVLGKGSFGKVFVLLRKEKGDLKLFAMKQIDKRMVLQKRVVRNIINEKYILAELGEEAPFIIHLVRTFQTEDNLCMVEDFMAGGDLRYHLSLTKNFTEDKVRFYASQMVLAIEHLHNRGYLHRDIKPDNLLLDEEGYCYLADFNVSIKAETCKRRAGTVKYMAPEVFDSEYDKKADFWSLGVTLYELYYGQVPFETEEQIQNGTLSFSGRSIHSDLKDLLTGLLKRPVNERLELPAIKGHPFFKNVDWEAVTARKLKAPYIPDKEKAHCSPDHEFEEVFGGSKKKKEKLTEADQVLFRAWDWELADDSDKGVQHAIRAGDLAAVIDHLKNQGPDHPIDARKNTCLHLAVFENKKEIVEHLLSVAKASVNCANIMNWTPLHEATAMGHIGMIRLLLAAGADVTATTKEGSLPFHFFMLHHLGESHVELLVQLSKQGQFINAHTSQRESSLHFACSSLHDTSFNVRYLLEQKADVNLFSKLGFTPLHRAVVRRKKDVMQILVDAKGIVGPTKNGRSMKELAEGDTDTLSILGGSPKVSRSTDGSKEDSK